MISFIRSVHAGPCACPHVSHWLAQYSILILIYIYILGLYIYLFFSFLISRCVTNVHCIGLYTLDLSVSELSAVCRPRVLFC